MKYVIEYVSKNNIILTQKKKNNYHNYLLSCSIENNTIDILRLLIKYAQNKHFILGVNECNTTINDDNSNPILLAIMKNNIEMVQLLMEYAENNNINLRELFYCSSPLFLCCRK